MSQLRWSRLPALAAVPALAALAVTGCSSGGSASPHAAQTGSGHATSTPSAATASYSANQLRGALLTKINGQSPAEPVESGAYGSLAEVKATRNSLNGVTVKPAVCVKTTVTGFNSPSLAKVPATCARYTATTKGKTFSYTVSEQSVRNLGRAARAMNIKATGAESINVWSVVYRGTNFVGAVTIVGPGASASVVTTLAAQAYAHAARTLH